MELTLERDVRFLPQRLHETDLLLGTFAARLEILAQPLEFNFVPADADAETEPPLAEFVEAGRLLGDQRRLALWGNDGRVSQADSLTCIKLIGQEVFPAIREIAKSLDLKSPFEANAPVHLKYSTDLKPRNAVAAE